VHSTANPEAELYFPLPPEGETWHPHMIHSYYFGFHIPEERIGAYVYLRCQPAFEMSGGGVVIHRGTDNLWMLDAEHVDYEATMAWPTITDHSVTTANGLSIDFLELGEKIRLAYDSNDGHASFDLILDAVTPLVARRRLMPGEESDEDPARNPGGHEQFVHITGTLVLGGEEYAVDCFNQRDRSWSQVRTERRNAVVTPPLGWGGAYFDDTLAFNQFGLEPPDTDPAWKRLGLFPDVPPDGPFHHWAWLYTSGELREVPVVRRTVHERDPLTYMPTRQQIELVDETGASYLIQGQVVSMSEVYGWPNLMGHDGVFRWETEDGRVAHGPYQEVWHDAYHRAMTAHYRAQHGEHSRPAARRR
jgi:hypothetical protein